MFAKDRCDNEVKQRIPGFRITDDLTALWHLGSNSWSRSAAFEKNVGLRAVNRVQEGAGIWKNDSRNHEGLQKVRKALDTKGVICPAE